MTPSWEPANETERALAAALDAGDIRAFARALMPARLYLPAKRGENEVVAFTSLRALRVVLGDRAGGHTEADFGSLAPAVPLTLNPGLPIAAVMPPGDLAALADGTATSVPVGPLRAMLVGEMNALIRQACLDELGDGTPPAETRPANELTRRLAAAAEDRDPDEFLDVLIGSEVVVPVSGPVPAHGDFPWRPVSAGELRIIPMFSSAELLDRVGASDVPRVPVLFLEALADWPEEDHVLCLDPGSPTEMVLPPDAVVGLIDSLAESLADTLPGLPADS